MKIGGKSILWSAIALVLLLSMGVPLLNVLTVTLMMVPYVVLYTTLSRGMFFAHLVPVWLIAYLALGPAPLIIGLFFLVPSIVMGHYFLNGRTVRQTMVAVMLTILGITLLELVLFDLFVGRSLIAALQDRLQEIMDTFAKQQTVIKELWTKETIDLIVKSTVQAFPQALLLMAFILTAVTQYLSRRSLRWSGVEVNGMPPARDWRLPRIMVTYYLIVIVLQLFVPLGDQSFMGVALLNLLPLLRFAFTVQAMGFFFYLAHQRGWAKPVPVLISIVLLLLPPLSLIGVLDAAFPIRKSFQKH